MPRAGQLLIASPVLPAPFDRAVILLVEHDESGTLGVVLNHPASLDVGEVLPDWRAHVLGDPVVFDGGPVARDSALGLAAVTGEAEPVGFRRVSGPLGLIDLDADADALAGHLVALRIFAGRGGLGARRCRRCDRRCLPRHR